MGGFGDVKEWNDLEAAARQVASQEGLSPEEREQLVAKMQAAVARASAQGKAFTTIQEFIRLVEGVSLSGGIRALLAL